MLPSSYLQDAIAQADWISTKTSTTDLDELFRTNPDLFDSLATVWRENHPQNYTN